MLTFLRKVRRSLLQADSFRKYLVYAAGEVILVMIGILLALYINNWNQSRIKEESIISKFDIVSGELLDNIWECKFWIEMNQYKDSLITSVVNQELTFNDYIQNPRYAEFIIMTHDIDLHDHEFRNLVDVSDQIPENLLKVYNDLVRLYNDRFIDVGFSDNQLQSFSYKKGDEWSTQYLWFKDIYTSELSDAAINYFINDPRYINEVTRFNDYFINTMMRCRLFLQAAVECYEGINNELFTNNDPDELIIETKKFLGKYNSN